MILGIMQPYFFPYLGYLSLIKHSDQFVLLSEVQFIRHGWIERNRILRPTESWQYIKVPLAKRPRDTKIKDMLIRNDSDWKQRIKDQLLHYKKTAPFFKEVMEFLDNIFLHDFDNISTFNMYCLKALCKYMKIATPINDFACMELEIDPVHAPDEWALNICRALGNVTEYWNPPGGMDFFDHSKYEKENISLKFHKLKLTEYNQGRPVFESGLSLIDVMMFNNVQQINEMLDNYELL